jgi:hypothetical protein
MTTLSPATVLLAAHGKRLDYCETLMEAQPSWPAHHPLKHQDFSAAPFWLTGGAEAMPIHHINELAAWLREAREAVQPRVVLKTRKERSAAGWGE